ncbi:MAG: hypothetical protein EXR93_07215 [Gemmatimonadetes bacterium]|nr:hypothetical protein [Gemmatimonadota bacterium]
MPAQPVHLTVNNEATSVSFAPHNGSVKVVRISNGALIEDIPLPGGPFGLRVSPNGQFITVTLAGDGKIVIFDRVLRRIVRTFNVGGKPRRIAFDATSATMAVANELNGVDVVR